MATIPLLKSRNSLFLTWLLATTPLFAQDPGTYQPPAKPLPATAQEASAEAAEAIADFRVPEGVSIQLVAAEPLLANPVAIEVDAKGRIFVAETYRQETEGVPDNRTFPEWLQDDLRLQTVEERAEMTLRHHPEFATEWTDRDDRIRLLEDLDGDGVAESSKIFAHGFNDLVDGTGAGLLARGTDVYYTCIPKLWKLSDDDADGVADRGAALHDGYGVRVAFRGHDMHGLVLGPMRKLYFSIGDRGYHVQTQEGNWLTEPGRGAVFRCDLDGSNLEVFARGLRNPQELAFDDFGNLFTVDNNCDAGDRARLVHVLEQGDCGWRMNFQYLPDRGPWMSESWWKPIAEAPTQPAFLNAPLANISSGPSGLAAYPGVGLRPEMKGSFFLCDFLGGANYSGIRRFTVKRSGASFALDQEEEYWMGVLATDVCFEPDGSMLISDWVRGWIGDGYGRLYRAQDASADVALMNATAALLGEGFSQREVTFLLSLLNHPDRRVRFEAQWELADRQAAEELMTMASNQGATLLPRVHAMWGLGMLLDPSQEVTALMVALTKDASLEIRTQAIKVLRRHAIELEEENLLPLLQDEALQVRLEAVLSAKARPNLIFKALEGVGESDRALVQAAGWSLAQGDFSETAFPNGWKTNSAARRVVVLALREAKDFSRLEAFLIDEDPSIANEAACAIYDLGGVSPQLAARLADAEDLPQPMARRAAAMCNRIGGANEARLLYAYVMSPNAEETLRKEVQEYIRNWDRPAEFDMVLNESQSFGPRIGDWFADKELPFFTAQELDAVERGRNIFTGHALAACTKCHSLRGVTPDGQINPAGPDLSFVGLLQDESELRQSILNPVAQIAKGFEFRDQDGEVLPVSTMPPNFADLLTEGEVEDLVAFLALQKQQRRILVHVDSQGYEHAVAKANSAGLSLVERSWEAWANADIRFSVTIDRGYERFNDQGLAEFDAVFFYTTGELPMDDGQKSALLNFVREGGTFVGSHCASDTFYQWPEYGAMLGGMFDGHPWHQEVRLTVEDTGHAATRGFTSGFAVTDEIYQFGSPYDRSRLHVLLSLDKESVSMESDAVHRTDGDFAVAWERREGKGGVFYTSLGHRPAVWKSEWFRDHLVEGTLAACDAVSPASIPIIEVPTMDQMLVPALEEEKVPTAEEPVQASGFRHEFAETIALGFAPVTSADGNTYWVSTTEVPWELYDLFFLREDEQVEVDGITGPSRSVFPVTRGFGHDGIPALGMTLHAAQEFCRWASQSAERSFRLPSEEEWRHAAGAAPAPKEYASLAWFSDNADDAPHHVAEKEPNAFGLYDMFGNVSEWVHGGEKEGVALGGSYLSDLDQIGPSARDVYSLSWQQRDPQYPKSSWWMSDAGFVGFRLVTLDGPVSSTKTD
ncbi:MAG: ThuA domain-containing protein [Planctomycetota bacterium]|nr:ThuA domain-containing protein [Planctomycetota bacterium]MDA1113382.1 ThuA domain-containing protein [Planctomycetota bacterium]